MKTTPSVTPPPRVSLSKTVALAALAILAAQPAHLLAQTWSGGGDGITWASTSNWTGGAAPTSAGTALFNSAPTATISLGGAAQSVKAISFDTSVGSFTFGTGLAGDQFNLTSGGNITLQSTATGTGLVETFTAPISLGGSYTITNNKADTTSALIFNGNITNTATSTLTISGNGTGTNNAINGNISDGTGVQSVTISASAGKWTLSGNNSYSGLTTLSGGGTVVLAGTNSSAGNTTISTTVQLDNASNGGLASGTLTTNNAAIQSLLANQAISNNVVVSGTTTFSGSNSLTLNGSITNTGSNRTITSSIAAGNALTFAGNIYLSETSATGRTLTIGSSANVSPITITGTISNYNGVGGAAGGLTLSPGVSSSVTISGANTYTGNTSFGSGITVAGSSTVVSGGSIISGPFGTGTLAFGSVATLFLKDNGTAITLANSVTTSGTVNFASTGSGSLTFDGTGLSTPATFTLTAATTLGVTNTTTIKDSISGSFALSKSGVGTLNLTGNNTFTGLLTANGGTTFISGDNSAATGGVTIGASSSELSVGSATALGTGTLTTNNTSILDNGSGAALTLTTNNAIIFNNTLTFVGTNSLNLGTGAVTLNANTAITVSANTLTIGGVIGGSKSLSKSGAGTLVLGSANTYTGTTTISAGTLQMGANNVFNATGAITLGGGTLALNGFSSTSASALSLTASSTINLGAGGTFAFADSHLTSWGSNALSITGSFVSGSSLQFGTDSTGLTSAQLALIEISGYTDIGINSSGFLTAASAIPEPATYAALAGLSVLGLAFWRRRRKGKVAA